VFFLFLGKEGVWKGERVAGSSSSSSSPSLSPPQPLHTSSCYWCFHTSFHHNPPFPQQVTFNDDVTQVHCCLSLQVDFRLLLCQQLPPSFLPAFLRLLLSVVEIIAACQCVVHSTNCRGRVKSASVWHKPKKSDVIVTVFGLAQSRTWLLGVGRCGGNMTLFKFNDRCALFSSKEERTTESLQT